MSGYSFWIGVFAATALVGAVNAETVMDDREFSGGVGTVADPYQISTPQQLQRMKRDPSAHYVLANDIDASETSTWDGGKGFNPVGDPAHPFTGSFDGRGRTISGLRIDRFGYVTTLGKLRVPISVVERITFNSDNETATLVMNNGDHLSGSVALTSFDLLAVWGQVSIPVQQMRLLAVQGGLFAGDTPFDANGDVSK